MRYLFYLGHPAHFHIFKHVVDALKSEDHDVTILIKKKDVLEKLVENQGWAYRVIQKRQRGQSKAEIAWSLLKRDREVFRIAKSTRPGLMIGTSAEIGHVGRVLGIPSIVVNEDDWHVVPYFAWLAYPFATVILGPKSCSMGRWSKKAVTYSGYQELAYLHPNWFTPEPNVVKTLTQEGNPYFILRFAELSAHHDVGKRGISRAVASELIRRLHPHGTVYITSERKLEPEFEPFRIQIDPSDMHSALAGAHLYIGDSQTMAAEAAVLGTPSIRFNDFVGKLGYLDELETRYQLTHGIQADQPEVLYAKVKDLLRIEDIKDVWARRREIMLGESVDLTTFLLWFIKNFPNSIDSARREYGPGSSVLSQGYSIERPHPVIK